jgi:hypothetical protein
VIIRPSRVNARDYQDKLISLYKLTVFKRDLNRTTVSELIKMSGSKFRKSIRRYENENKRGRESDNAIESGSFSFKRWKFPISVMQISRCSSFKLPNETFLFCLLLAGTKQNPGS